MHKVRFFSTVSGSEPVREWMRSLDRDERFVIGTDLLTVQYGFPIGMPLCRALGDGLYEVRSSLPSRREARVIFFADGEDLIVVSGFIKKSQKTPKNEIDLARRRKREYQQHRTFRE